MNKLFIAITAILFAIESAWAQQNVAIVAKTRGTTFHKRFNTKEYKPQVPIGTQLKNHDWIKTGDNGYLALFFLDDKSQLKVKGNSEMEILGKIERGRIDKTISMDYGQVKAKVQKQKGEFRIATPTSVASVKGTEFWVISNEDGDQFIGLEGQIVVENRVSGETVTVGSDQTATSTPDGNVEVSQTEEGTVPEDPDAEEEEGQPTTTTHILRIRLTNQSGGEHFLIIEYSE